VRHDREKERIVRRRKKKRKKEKEKKKKKEILSMGRRKCNKGLTS
jgi:hypothetical protein